MTRCGIVLMIIFSLTIVEFCHCSSNQKALLARSTTARRLREIGRRIRSFVSWIKNLANDEDSFVGRCAGMFKQLRMTMTFIVFKLGVIVTTLFFLTILAFKSIGIGVLLLLLSSIGLTTKLHGLKHDSGIHWHATSPTASQTAPQQTIHLHVHKGGEHETKVNHVSEPHYASSSSEHHYDHHYDHNPNQLYDSLYDYHHPLDGLYPRNQLERSAVAELYKRLGLVKTFPSNLEASVRTPYR